MSKLPEEQRIREVLRELKSRADAEDVRDDIERIERILQNPLFRQLSTKKKDDGENEKPAFSRSGLLEFLRLQVEERSKKLLKSHQKLKFCEFDASSLPVVVLDTREKPSRLLVVGPKDVKSRSQGKLRIGDCVLAVAFDAIPARPPPRLRQPSGGGDCQTTPEGGVCYSNGGGACRPSDAATADAADDEDHDAVAEDPATPTTTIVERPDQSQFSAICQQSPHIAVGIVRESTQMVLSGDWTQVEVIRLSTEEGGLGFGIVGGTSTGVVVKTILPGSPADKDGRLRPGDHILQIANVNTHGMSSQQVATILRHQHPTVEMIVGRPINYAEKPADTSDCFTIATRAALCASTLEESLHRQMATTSSASTSAANATPSSISPSASCVPVEDNDVDNENNVKKAGDDVGNKNKVKKTGDVVGIDVDANVDQKMKLTPHCEEPNGKVGHGETPSTSTACTAPAAPVVHVHVDLRKPCNCAPPTSVRRGDKRSSIPKSTSSDGESAPKRKVSSSGERSLDSTAPEQGKKTNGKQISLRCLQEMALTVFLRENWQEIKYETVEVVLQRDAALGLGITVAGYVHRKEEIGGIFVKSLVPRSAAAQSSQIRVHDLILEVNGTSLEHLSHADSVRTLVKSGDEVRLKLVRFPLQSAQAQCLKMLQQQETETQVIDVKSSNPDLVSEWKRKLAEDVEIVTAVVKPDRKGADGGLGISLEGTVDVMNGHQLCPHHYIESIRENGPVAKSGQLQSGDELLQVNHSPLYGESHVTVRQALTRAVHSGAPVTLIVARRNHQLNRFQSRNEKSLPLSYPLLASGHDNIVKAKSEVDISSTRAETTQLLQKVSRRLRSRSLEHFNGLAVWNCVPLVIYLDKDARGLGFSIVDYQDPSHSGESVIVVQSLVPGGVAQADGRIVPGDRLLFVNDHDLSNSSLERAVAVLKAARMGPVRLGIAKPIPIDQCRVTSHSPLYSRSERLLARGRSPRSRRRQPSGVSSSQETVWIGTAEQYRRLHPQAYFPSRSPSCTRSERSLDGSEVSMASWSPCSTRSISPSMSPVSIRGSWAYDVVYLPSHLERSVKIQKGALPLGVVLDADKDKGVNGCAVKSICGKKAVALDGRIQVGDYIVKISTESLRNATNAQARAILKRTNLIGSQCNITYITSSDAKTWKERFHREVEPQSPAVNRLSPKVFPKFYRSPYMNKQDSVKDTDDEETDAPSMASEDIVQSVAEQFVSSQVAESPRPSADSRTGLTPDEEQTRRRRLSQLVDGIEIENFVQRILQEALEDATVELHVSQRIPDWSPKFVDSSTSTAAPERGDNDSENDDDNDQSPSTSVEEHGRQEDDDPVAPEAAIIGSQSVDVDADENDVAEKFTVRILSTKEEIDKVVEVAEASTRRVSIKGDEKAAGRNGDVEKQQGETTMSRVTSRTPSTGSESLQQQARQLARSKYWGEARTVVLNREPNKSFGISIVGGRVEVSQKGGLPGTGNTVSGIFIKSVLPNSPAGRSGQMNMGDRVISVNDVDLRDATHEQAVAAIKNATNPVKFVLQSLHTNQHHMINSASNSTVGSIRLENSKGAQDEIIVVNEPPAAVAVKTTPSTSSSLSSDSAPLIESLPPTATSSTVTATMSVDDERPMERADQNSTPVPNDTTFHREDTVKPTRRSVDQGDGRTSEERSKLRKTESREKDDVNRRTSVEKQPSVDSQGKASIRSSSSKKKSKSKESQNASTPLIVSDVSSTETRDEGPDEIVEQWESLSQLGVERASAAALPKLGYDDAKPSKFCYTIDKLQRKYGTDGEVLLVECGQVPEAGLGISLAGNRNREKQSVFVVNVKVACPLPIRVGDELLEVNGRVLQGLTHVTASAIIKECCDKTSVVEIALRRREGALDECAVRSEELPSTSSVATASSSDREAMAEEPVTATTTTTTMMMINMTTASSSYANDPATRKKSLSLERTALIETGKETLIEIDKDGKGLGLSIVGGSDTVLGTVVIHEVYPDGAAAHDGRLKPGDQVLEVNNVSLRGFTHDHAISALRRTPPKVRLLIYRDVNLQLSLLDPTQIYNIFEVELQKKPGRGLGLSIVGRKNEPGVYVSEIVKGGAAEADGRLMTGDQILAVNGQDVANCMQEDVAAMLKTCTGKVHLKVGRWKITETANRVHAAAEAASLAKSCTTPRVSRKVEEPVASTSKCDDRRDVPPPAPPMRPIITHTNPDGGEGAVDDAGLSPVTEEPSSGTDLSDMQKSMHEEATAAGPTTSSGSTTPLVVTANNNSLAIDILHDLKEEGSESLLVELRKAADQQLGMGIGKRTRGILVTSLQPGSAAAEKLRVGDRIMAVNALPVTDQLSAVTFVKASGERLFLQIARPRLSPS